MVTPQSSSIHLGPDTPLGGMTPEMGDKLTNIKSKLFLLAIFLQLTLFACIRFNIVQMPKDSDSDVGEEEDMIWEEDDEELLGRLEQAFRDNEDGKNSAAEEDQASQSARIPKPDKATRSATDDSIDDSVLDSFRRFIPTTKRFPLGFSLTFIENGYIILWICKDYFWSWATGDFEINRNAGYVTEVVSMFFGVLSVCLYTFVAFAWRKHFVNLMDSLTSWCWLFSNFTWMAGEIFIRYDNMELNDDNQGDDGLTRLVSGIFFIVGINIQLCVLCHYYLENFTHFASSSNRERTSSGSCTSDSSSSKSSADELPEKWSSIEIGDGKRSKGGHRAPKLSLGFLPNMGSKNQKFVNIQSMEVDRND